MNKFRIALISDLHVGSSARGVDLCPHPLSDEEKVLRSPDYIAAFERWATENILTNSNAVDLLCITGDISNRAHADEFKYADRAIARISEALQIPTDRVYFVPGNHDVNWPVMAIEPTSFWKRHRYAPLFQQELRFHQRATQAASGSLESEPYFVAWEDEDVIVLGINSAAYDGPTASPHHGIIRQETVDAIDKYMGGLEKGDKRLRICLLHHHLEQYSDPIPNYADHSIATNAENLVNVLSNHRIDLLLHGHKHYPRLSTRQPDNRHPFISVCAGSFSALLNVFHDGIPNQFHVINVDGRETATQRIFGSVENWSFQSNQWKPSSGVSGMYAKEAFGSAATPAEIRNAIRESMNRNLGSRPYVDWQTLVRDNPTLALVRTDAAFDAFVQVSSELGCDVAGDKQVTTNRAWIAYRRIV